MLSEMLLEKPATIIKNKKEDVANGDASPSEKVDCNRDTSEPKSQITDCQSMEKCTMQSISDMSNITSITWKSVAI